MGAMTPPPPTLVRQIADRLTAAIRAGVHPPGSRLPSVRELQASEGVARQTAANALDLLVEEGWARQAPGSGTYVADPLPAEPARPVSLEDRVAALEEWRRSVEGA